MSFDGYQTPGSEGHYIHRPLSYYATKYPTLPLPGSRDAPFFDGGQVSNFFRRFEAMGARLGFSLIAAKEMLGYCCSIRTRDIVHSCSQFHKIQFDKHVPQEDLANYDASSYPIWKLRHWRALHRQVEDVFSVSPPFTLADLSVLVHEFSSYRHLNLAGYSHWFNRFHWVAGWIRD